MRCVVLRSFGGPDGVKYQIGEKLDCSDWRNTETLVLQRYIRILPSKRFKEVPFDSTQGRMHSPLFVKKRREERDNAPV